MSFIRVIDVSHHYVVRWVLHSVSFDVERGDLVVIMGPNGMGKSTLLSVMAGVLSPQRGVVEIDGRRRRGSVADEPAIRRQVAYLPDQPFLPIERTPRQLLVGAARLYLVGEERAIDHTERLLHLFHLDREADSPIGGLSSGQKKKTALASALVTEAPILLLDEPFSGGLDPAGIVSLREVLKRLAAREDVTVIMTSPVPELSEAIADRVLILRDGRVAAYETIERLRADVGGGSLGEVLERLVDSKSEDRIRRYFGD